MGADSKIEWTHHTFNPWEGCTKVSPGCMHCYAEARDVRFTGGIHWGKGAPRRRTSIHNWNEPRRWNAHEQRAFEKFGPRLPHISRPRVFCASLADWLDDEVPIEWLADLLCLIRTTPHLDWLLLTKRPENWQSRLRAVGQLFNERSFDGKPHDEELRRTCLWVHDWLAHTAPANVWIGTTVEDQARADERVPVLLKIPAKVRFLSCEPLLGPIDLENLDVGDVCFECCQPVKGNTFGASVTCGCCGEGPEPVTWGALHWVICGGESGKDARPMRPDWARSLRDQCINGGVPFFFKQWGEWGPYDRGAVDTSKLATHGALDTPLTRWGKITAGRRLDDREHSDFPK